MAVGLSDGTVYNDESEWLAAADHRTPKQISDQSEINSNTTSGDFRSRFGGAEQRPLVVITKPPQAPAELADALKSSAGMGTPANGYNTQLSTEEQADYDSKFSPQDSQDYDMQGWYKMHPDADPHTDGTHYPDTWKKPSHPTFSDQSIYHSDETLGGQWQQGEDKSWTFTPGPQNLKNGIDKTKDYLQQSDPNVKLNYQEPNLTGYGGIPKEGIQVNPYVHIGPEDIDKGIGIAMSFGTGTMQGIKGGTFNRSMLYKAQEAEAAGTHPDEVWNQTGTFRGADGRWRQEINDSGATLKDSAFNHTITPGLPALPDSIKEGRGNWTNVSGTEDLHTVTLKGNPPPMLKDQATIKELADWFQAKKAYNAQEGLHLPDVIDHPELFKAYPDLKAVRVEPLPEAIQKNTNVLGHMSEDGPAGTLRLRDDLDPSFAKSVIMHEVQHRIQRIEGFATGGNAEQFLPKELGQAEKEFKTIRSEAMQKSAEEMGVDVSKMEQFKRAVHGYQEGQLPLEKAGPVLDLKEKFPQVYNRLSNISKSEKLIADAKNEAFDKYQRLMGEVEARTVQARLNYSARHREVFSPRGTEENIMPRSQQIP